jgi:hypothetical protein
MKHLFFFTLLLFAIESYSAEPEIEVVQTLFEASPTSKAAADRLSTMLSTIDQNSAPLLICYKGAAEMMQAKYKFNPINKFHKFKTGKKLIEEAVKKEADNIEIRFLRFAIQTNLPGFLNYNDHIQNDKKFLLNNLQKTKDKRLKQNILNYLLASKHCSAAEKKGLKT